jgi:hypothetical protein
MHAYSAKLLYLVACMVLDLLRTYVYVPRSHVNIREWPYIHARRSAIRLLLEYTHYTHTIEIRLFVERSTLCPLFFVEDSAIFFT